MTEKIRLAMQACADDPAADGRALQPVMSENPDVFVRQLCDPDSFGRETLTQRAAADPEPAFVKFT